MDTGIPKQRDERVVCSGTMSRSPSVAIGTCNLLTLGAKEGRTSKSRSAGNARRPLLCNHRSTGRDSSLDVPYESRRLTIASASVNGERADISGNATAAWTWSKAH